MSFTEHTLTYFRIYFFVAVIILLGRVDNLEALNLESEESINEYELSENIDIYYISNSNIECIGLQAFAPNWYRDIKSKKDIEKIVQRLEDIQIIGEIPMKYWEKNAIECKINIINPEYIIKTSPIEIN